MSPEPLWRRYLRFFGQRSVADLDDELRFHIEMRVRDYMARGHSEAESRALTAARLGDLGAARAVAASVATKRDTRARRAQILDAFTQDIAFAFRTLGRQKAWTAVAVLTLSLGVGVSAGMFSVLNHLLLHPLSYPDASRVAVVYQLPSQGNNTGMNVTMIPSAKVTQAWREDAKSFEAIEPYTTTQTTLDRTGDEPQTVSTAHVLPSFATFTGERPLRGRLFTADEARDGAGVVLISERMWRSRFGAQDSVIGQTFTAFDKPQTVIGVMPASFQLPRTMEEEVDLWAPLDLARAGDDGMQILARLRPGITRVSAAAELDSITSRRDLNGKREPYTTFAGSPTAFLSIKDSLTMMGFAVALVLLIACANVAHLLLARGSTRQREMAIRAALGAGRGRLFRQLVTESVVLSVAGCIGGLVVGWAALRAMVALRPNSLSELSAAHMDWWTLSLTAVIAATTSVAFGLIGGSQAARHSTSDALKTNADRASQGRLSVRARGLLVVTEMAFCTMLLVGAVLLIRSLVYLQTRDTGFDARGLYTLDVSLPAARYPKDTKHAFHRDLAARAAAMPGIAGVTIAAAPPMSQTFLIGALQIGGQPNPPNGTSGFIACNSVEPGYFSLMRMRMVRGSTFTDTTDAAAQVIVNESMERQLWPGQSALGQRLRVAYNGTGLWRTVVGVTTDALNGGRTDRGAPLLYLPPAAMFGSTVIVRAKGDGDAAALVRQVADIARQIDPTLRKPTVTSVEYMMQRSLSRPRFMMLLLSLFAAIAVGLAAVGLYGVLAYSVAQRTREIGIRVALGATRGDVARSVATQGIGLAVAGAVIGLIGARGGVSIVAKLLYGVKADDALSFALSAAALVVIAAVACLVPMRRALAVDPLIAMKAD